MSLKNKTVVITGGSEGLGKALAKILINEGARVMISARNKEKLESAAKEIGAVGFVADVTKEKEVEALGDYAVSQFIHIDIWINNAGLWKSMQYAEDFNMDEIKPMFDVNIFGTILGSRAALRRMKKEGKGTILNVLSSSALVGRPKGSMYATTKWAMNGFTKSIREENKDTGISVLAIFPGAFKTDIFKDTKPETFDSFMDVEYVAQKAVDNLKLDDPELDLNIEK